MRERRQIVELARRDSGSGVLVTLVRVEGSSYRRPGARLLVGDHGYAGTISGGCLESEVQRRAAWMVVDGARVERYEMSFDDTADIPFGLGCGGTVDLLFEKLDTPEGKALLEALERSLAGSPGRVVHFMPGGGRGLRRLILDATDEVVFASEGLSAKKIACARALVAGGTYEGRFVETLDAPQRLILLGAGDDARPMVELAALQGWRVTVADGRTQLARADRFPQAERVCVVERADELPISANDAVVLMTHSYEQDRELLAGALASGPRYLGLLGSRHRSSLLVSEAAVMLGRSVEECCEGLFAPVGLDLGGDGPEAIALAVIAEVQAVANGRLGAVRRMSADEVAGHVAKGGVSSYLRAQCAMGVA